MNEQELWDKLYSQMDKGLITWTEMMNELSFQGFKFGINEGIAR
jgi:hypothetical protein